MARIFAILANGLLTFLSVRFAFEAHYPLRQILIIIAVIGALHFVLIVWGAKFPSRLMRYMRPAAAIGNTALLLTLLPLAFMILSSAENGTGARPAEDILTMSCGIGVLLLLIVFNFSLVQR